MPPVSLKNPLSLLVIWANSSYANSRLTTKHNVGPLCLPDGSITVDLQLIKATLLSQYFDSVYTNDNGDLPTTSTKATIDSALSSLNSTTVFKTHKKFNVRSAGGPDHVPPIFLNKCSNNLSYPISFLFQLYFDNSFLPKLWRQAWYVTPVFKKGDSSAVGNYRPISLTSTLCKLMECNQGSITLSTCV